MLPLFAYEQLSKDQQLICLWFFCLVFFSCDSSFLLPLLLTLFLDGAFTAQQRILACCVLRFGSEKPKCPNEFLCNSDKDLSYYSFSFISIQKRLEIFFLNGLKHGM